MESTTVTRRRWLAGMAAALAPLVLGGRAFAFEKAPDNASKADFKRLCQSIKGATWDEGKYSTSCRWSDGDVKVCDENGKNCTRHESADGGPASGPFGDPLEDIETLSVLTAQPEATGAAPKAKGKKGGKRRKR